MEGVFEGRRHAIEHRRCHRPQRVDRVAWLRQLCPQHPLLRRVRQRGRWLGDGPEGHMARISRHRRQRGKAVHRGQLHCREYLAAFN